MDSTRSAFASLATSAAPGCQEWGSPPVGSRLNTSTRSPPTIRVQSAAKFVVVMTLSFGASLGAGWAAAPAG